ncbi:ABC transporter substrate-binding protein [Colwellia sp. BRX8-7]|jgi:ABC-type amino acid transport substrate-binding protein|uniref:substrate-binding periplasmic protein n=1 Tax=Colwellia sp. BRX8-7 TaxID=2759833 RepID=UPI0015F3DC37|nr:ABC transporter substrate-binding protein [Colwellia sp. BRX8-7]
MIYKKRIILFLLLACFKVSASMRVPLILNDIDWPPFFLNNEEESLKGVAKDILEKCVDNKVYQQKFIKLPVKRTHVYMQSGEIDISIYSYNKFRKDFVIYSKEPMFTSDYGFVVSAESSIEINELNDLSPYVIGHLSGLSHTPEIMQIIKDKRLKKQVFDGYNVDAMFKQLLAEKPRFDIMINSKETFYWRANVLNIKSKVRVLDYNIKVKNYFLTVSKASKNIENKEQFLNNFDACLVKIKEQGQYKEILAKYGL